MTLPEKIIVDTNVPINANLANTPKEIPAGMLNCVLSCIIAIECVIKQGGDRKSVV